MQCEHTTQHSPHCRRHARLVLGVAGTEWSLIVRCFAAQDLRYQCSDNQLTAISYLHHLSGYRSQLPHLYDSINPTDSHLFYPGPRTSRMDVATRRVRDVVEGEDFAYTARSIATQLILLYGALSQ